MIYFDHNGERYHLRHHNENDTRSVVKCDDFDFKGLLKFDCSLNVLGPSGLVLGRLRGFTESGADEWSLLLADGSVTNLGVPVNDYSWQGILKAEVEASKALL
jgi:hypothetical protein